MREEAIATPRLPPQSPLVLHLSPAEVTKPKRKAEGEAKEEEAQGRCEPNRGWAFFPTIVVLSKKAPCRKWRYKVNHVYFGFYFYLHLFFCGVYSWAISFCYLQFLLGYLFVLCNLLF